MPKPRYRLVDTATTPYYHCVSRCVRRAFLCGTDRYTGKNFDHRKEWVISRVRQLSAVFAIDVCAYAIMSNHFHLVVHIDARRAETWSHDKVMDKWLALYKGPDLVHRYRDGETLSPSEQAAVSDLSAVWKKRLADLSWYMRCLNETIARMANFEDDCTGRFWEGRFRSQALLDESALVGCMAYVDLNPVRAGLCEFLWDSDFTSIQERLREYAKGKADDNDNKRKESWLLPFSDEKKGKVKLPLTRDCYLEMVDWTGRIVRKNKNHGIPGHVPPLLASLGIEQQLWAEHVTKVGCAGIRASGQSKLLRVFALKVGQKWLNGRTSSWSKGGGKIIGT